MRGEIIRGILEKVKGVVKKKQGGLAPPFPSLKTDALPQAISTSRPFPATGHVTAPSEKQHPISQAFSGEARSPPDAALRTGRDASAASKPELSFPELKVPPKKQVDYNSIVNTIIADVQKNNISATHSVAGQDTASLPSGLLANALFFEKIERLLQDTQLSEQEVKNLLEKDIFAKMKEYHGRKKEGKSYVFDKTDYDAYVMEKIHSLKSLEDDWIRVSQEVSALQDTLREREEKIEQMIDDLKQVMAKHGAFEKQDLLAKNGKKGLQRMARTGGAVAASAETALDPLIGDMRPFPASSPPASPLIAGIPEQPIASLPGQHPGGEVMPAAGFSDEGLENAGLAGPPAPTILDKLLPPDKAFILADGRAIASLRELQEMLSSVDDTVFSHHVNAQENHFLPWLSLFDPFLSEQAKGIRAKEEFSRFLDALFLDER
ncbi:MAG: hypothetical protein ABIJ21_03860 [Nanoarchaeota archaeon]